MDEPSSPPPGGDAELIDAIASGDSAAYVTLHERHVAAARSLARQLVASSAEAEEVITETFTRLYAVLRQGGGPDAAVRPYLLTAVRRVAGERSGGQPEAPAGGWAEAAVARRDAGGHGGGQPRGAAAQRPGHRRAGERAHGPRLRLAARTAARGAVAHRDRAGRPGQAALVLGVTADGVAELAEQARAGLSRAYLKLYLSGLTREDCRSAAGKLDLHLSRAGRLPMRARCSATCAAAATAGPSPSSWWA